MVSPQIIMYWLKFVQNAVHYPVGRSGTDPVAGADCLSLQMLYYRFNQRELYMRRVRRQDFFTSAFCMQGYRVVGEDGEANHAFVSDNLNTVFLGGVVGYKAPGT